MGSIRSMIYKYDQSLVKSAQSLRKNMTPEEKHLWYDFLKKLPITVNRQKNIGRYIVDLFIADKRIVIEIDGIQHTMPEAEKADRQRDIDLANLGVTVLRYGNLDINKNFNRVCEDILNHLGLNIKDLK